MDTRDAVSLAEYLLEEYGLNGWAVRLDRSKIRFGQCQYRNSTISLSRALVEANDTRQVDDTIRHEIAHALVGPGKGHGREWKLKCIETGANPQRCYDSNQVVAAPAPWALVCEPCGVVVPRHRRTNKLYGCRKCGKQVTWQRTA